MKRNLLLLHGAIGTSQQLHSLAAQLQPAFNVYLMNFRGHGDNTCQDSFSISGFAEQTSRYIQQHHLAPVWVFGYSMGGYVAMYLAARQPELVAGICTLGTKFYWDEATAAKEIKMLDAGKIAEKLPAFATLLQERHTPNDWKTVLQKTAGMMTEMGRNNPLPFSEISGIHKPVLLLLGDRDKMVSVEETVQVYKALPRAQLSVSPDTAHPVEEADAVQIRFQVERFIGKFQ